MTVLTVAVIIIGLAVVVEGLFILGLVRAYRAIRTSSGTAVGDLHPAPGYVLTTRDAPEEVARVLPGYLSGWSLVLLVTSRCKACDGALAALRDRSALPLPTLVVFQCDGSVSGPKAEALDALAKQAEVVETAASLMSLPGLGSPTGFPLFLTVADGVVLHRTFSGEEALDFASRLATARP